MTQEQFKLAMEELRDTLTNERKCALIYPMALDVIASTPWLMARILAALQPNVGT